MSLSKKLSWLLMGLFLVIGVVLAYIIRITTVQYNLEITQRLNGSIAMYVAAEEQLIENGQHNEAAIKRLAERAMVINPTVEVYLLDAQGNILSHNIPDDAVLQRTIPLDGIQAFMQADAKRPLLSLDPRSPENHKAFSAAEVRHNGELEGYVYAILGGQAYEQLAKDISQNYILQVALASIVVLLLMGFILAWLMVRILTRPLKQLTHSVVQFQQHDNVDSVTAKGDEIAVLQQAFSDMKSRINQQMNQIKAADQNRRDLISNVSHDLRTPLSSVQGYLDTLVIKGDVLSEAEKVQFMATASKHCQRLNQLVGDLFELSKLDSLAIQPKMEPFSMAELMQDVSMAFQHQCSERQITMAVSVPDSPCEVVADIGLIQRVLENLIGNAVKHTEAGGQVALKLVTQNDNFQVVVEDTGCGISEEELPHIFERLYRAENSATSQNNSSGLGLAIVKKIIELHNSSIQVVSQLGQGSAFTFEMPRMA